jgi:hypothetical protein
MAKAVELLNSRLEAMGAQYNQGMGRSDQPITLLKPHAQAVFSALQEGGPAFFPVLAMAPRATSSWPQGGGPKPPGGIPRADYSSMVGGKAVTALDPSKGVLGRPTATSTIRSPRRR